VAPLHGVGRGFESLIAHINRCGKTSVTEGTHHKMDNIKVRCRSCGKELIGHPSKAVSCGCFNMTTIRGDKISAVDLSQVIMLNSYTSKKENVLTQEDIRWQEQRRQRKVRKMNFEVR
jgi:hypothetical protein